MLRDTHCNHVYNSLQVEKTVRFVHNQRFGSTGNWWRTVNKAEPGTRAEILLGDGRNPKSNESFTIHTILRTLELPYSSHENI